LPLPFSVYLAFLSSYSRADQSHKQNFWSNFYNEPTFSPFCRLTASVKFIIAFSENWKKILLNLLITHRVEITIKSVVVLSSYDLHTDTQSV